MPANANLTLLLASPDPILPTALQQAQAAMNARLRVAHSAEAAITALATLIPPAVAVLDAGLPGMETGRLLAAIHSCPAAGQFPIVLISDTVTQQILDRLDEGVIDDLLPRDTSPAFLAIRISAVLNAHCNARELESLREAATLNAQFDRLTGAYNRETMLAMLFRETDRVQRMNGSLSLMLFDIDDFGHWNMRLGVEACDELLRQTTSRSARILRSYDLLSRIGEDEFLIALPGCGALDAAMLAERLRLEVFCQPFTLGGDTIRLGACFGIAQSHGRSPVVVLREAEQALSFAKAAGPESIQCYGEDTSPQPTPVTFLSPSSGDELLAW